MAMSYVWCFLLLVSIAYSIFAGTAPQTGSAALSGAQSGVTLAISLAGVLCLWSGLSRVMEKSGLAAKLASLLRPLLARLFPDSARDAAALQNLSGNFTANLLGLGSAATPLGIAAVRRMQALSGSPDASDEMCRLIVLNPPRRLADLTLLCHGGSFCGKAFFKVVAHMTDILVPVLLLLVSCHALHKKEDVYSLLVLGAQDGLRLLSSILPALVILLTAVSMLRESGCLTFLTRLFSPVCSFFGIPSELVPLMLVRPLSGSAALAVGAELMRTHGVDSLIGRTAAVMLGSTETTFYTISVYFGAAGVRRTRYTLPAACIADLTGFFVAALSTKLLF